MSLIFWILSTEFYEKSRLHGDGVMPCAVLVRRE